MNTKHTPGPWKQYISGGYQAVGNGDGSIAPMIYGNDAEGEQAEANARLIAASPRMYDRLCELIGREEADKLVGW